MRHEGATRCGAGLHRNGAHMSVISIVTIGMTQTDINAQIDLVILRVPPTRVDNLICICGRVHGAIRDAIIHAIVPIVINPIAEAVRPVPTLPRIANSGLWRRCAWRCRYRTILTRLILCKSQDDVVICIVGRGVIENGFLRSGAWIRRIEKRSHGLL